MPIYAYQCSDCGFTKDVLQKLRDEPLRQCPDCGHQAFARLLSAPNFQLKGSGWYVTDFRNPDAKGGAKAGAEGTEAAGGAEGAPAAGADAAGGSSAAAGAPAAGGGGSGGSGAAVPAPGQSGTAAAPAARPAPSPSPAPAPARSPSAGPGTGAA